MKPVVYPADWLFRDPEPPLSDFGRRLLAEGDSWFTIGTLNLPQSSNLLFKLEFGQSTAIVSCAYPGDTLQHMVDHVNDPFFDRLLRQPNFERFWEGIVLSAGGNDLIDAARSAPLLPDGSTTPLAQRLFLLPAEVPAGAGPEGFVSDAGWQTLARYLVQNFAELVKRRDDGISRGRPIMLHTYAVPTVRPSGTVGSPQGWLFPAMERYGIPPGARQTVCAILFGRLQALLLSLDEASGMPESLPGVHVFDSASLPEIEPAAPDSGGVSGDWVNEIHLTPAGYAKIGARMGPWMERFVTL